MEHLVSRSQGWFLYPEEGPVGFDVTLALESTSPALLLKIPRPS